MARTSASSPVNSLRAKIWLATTALGVFITTFGLISYLVLSFLVNDTFYAVFIPFLLLAAMVVVFGWRLAAEIVNPVEKVSLLAKSFERGITTSLPKTSGASETDELLETVYRLSGQTQKLVNSMDEVANGNLDVVFAPNSVSDRAGATFQKLLAKVSESIHARQELESLQAAVGELAEEISAVRRGNLDVKPDADFAGTKEVSQTLIYLVGRLNEIVTQVKTSGAEAQSSVAETRKTLTGIIEQDEDLVREMNQAAVTLKQVPQTAHKISEDFLQSAAAASQSIEKAQRGTRIAEENLKAVGALRRHIQETLKRIHRLHERSRDIGDVAKTIEDLARRTTMVALNASIQTAELGEAGRGFVVVAEEVERLAARAGETSKHISSLNKSVQSDIGEVESSLEATFSEAASLSKFAIETGSALGELEKYASQSLNLQSKLADYSREQTEEAEGAFRVFTRAIAETAGSLSCLKESAQSLRKAADLMEDMEQSAADFKTPPKPGAEEVETLLKPRGGEVKTPDVEEEVETPGELLDLRVVAEPNFTA